MGVAASTIPGEARLSDADLSRIVRLVYERSGITLHSGKRALVLAVYVLVAVALMPPFE